MCKVLNSSIFPFIFLLLAGKWNWNIFLLIIFFKIITTYIILITKRLCYVYVSKKIIFRETVGTVSLSRRLENLRNISVRNVCGINPWHAQIVSLYSAYRKANWKYINIRCYGIKIYKSLYLRNSSIPQYNGSFFQISIS